MSNIETAALNSQAVPAWLFLYPPSRLGDRMAGVSNAPLSSAHLLWNLRWLRFNSNDSWRIRNEVSDRYFDKTMQNEFIQLLINESLKNLITASTGAAIDGMA